MFYSFSCKYLTKSGDMEDTKNLEVMEDTRDLKIMEEDILDLKATKQIEEPGEKDL